jgi:hypothetical protein
VEFYANGELIGVDRSPLFRWDLAEPSVGDHEIFARLVYEDGHSTTTDSVRVTVNQ